MRARKRERNIKTSDDFVNILRLYDQSSGLEHVASFWNKKVKKKRGRGDLTDAKT